MGERYINKLAVIVVILVWSPLGKNIWCSCRLSFPDEFQLANGSSVSGNNQLGTRTGSGLSSVGEKWSWRALEIQDVQPREVAWRWTPPDEKKSIFPTTTTRTSNNLHKNSSLRPKWPRSTLFKTTAPSQFQYASRFTQNQTQVLRGPTTKHFSLPEKLQNYYTQNFGNMPSGSSHEQVKVEWLPPPKQLQAAQTVYPKHLYYGYPRETKNQKRFSLEIHPAYIVAPLAGLATFGLVKKIVSTPVLLELGLVNNDKDKNSQLHHHQHNHEHHHQLPGHPPPGIIGLWPVPIPPYPSASATATASASASAQASASAHASASATEFPIIFGSQYKPGLGPISPEPDNRPWWTPFASMIPRLRLEGRSDVERDR